MEEKRRLSRVEINHQREKKKRVYRWIKYIIGIIFLFACIYVTAVYLKTKNAFDKTYDPQNSVTQAGFSSKKKFAVLLLGTDTGALGRHEKRGNTDTIIVATVNPNDKKVSLMSIPRDTMAEMIGSPKFSV
ncbi:MAG: LCP family protein, partial [Lactobacillus iners]|nr:LCP family protein [Lactobacillus iners]